MSAKLGITRLLESLPAKPVLLVLNYHRIGDRDNTPYDPGIFSTTAEEFERQIDVLGRRFTFATLQQAIEIATGRIVPDEPVVLITFDDGYLDNYELAYPVLRARKVQGVFFLPTQLVGTDSVPWWDQVAWILKQSRESKVRMQYPAPFEVDLKELGMFRAIQQTLAACTSAESRDTERFVSELADACGSQRPTAANGRCFLNWDEAREMLANGMAFGSHTHSHSILTTLSPDQQYEELRRSKEILEAQLSTPIRTVAYPVGRSHTFSGDTFEAARRAGYEAGFSFYGGINVPRQIAPLNILRNSVEWEFSIPRVRLQTALGSVTQSYWI